ncbi:MAG: hypothetical protein M3083_25320 [Actinomycetota bacterium]|nr:hypothetical protein [Actinomycetota bacterium]MDQ6946621.1 hypothetical protein [Actinomycetota bacterium]
MTGWGRRRLIRQPPLAAMVAYLALAFLLFAGAWRSPSVRHIGTPGDPPLNMWFLSWTRYALSHLRSPFYSNHINYPLGANLMWNPLMFIPGVILWPVTANFGPVVSYNTLVTLNIAMSAWCGYLAYRTFVSHELAAFIGGLVYGFSPYMLAQSRDHPSLTAAFLPPLMLLALIEILVRQRRPTVRSGVLLGLLAVMQLLTTEELLATEAVAAALGLVVLCLLYRRQVAAHAAHAAVALGYAFLVFVVLAAGPLGVQFFGPQGFHGALQPPNVFVSDLANVVLPTGTQQLPIHHAAAFSRPWSGNPSEWDMYLGVPYLLVIGYVCLRLWRRAVVRVSSILALALVILSFGPHLHLNGRVGAASMPWRWVGSLPLINNVLPSRLALYVDLFAALLLAVFADHVMGSRSITWRLAGWAALVAVGASLFPAIPYPSTAPSVPPFFTSAAARVIPEGSVVLIAPFQQLYPDEPMLWQADTNMRFRMPQGYFVGPNSRGHPVYGAPPSTLSQTMLEIQSGAPPPMTSDLRSSVLRDLALRKVRTVLVGPMAYQFQMLQFFGYLFDRPPVATEGVYLWRDTNKTIQGVAP